MGTPINVLELRSVRGTGGGPEKTILLGSAATDPHRFAITVCYVRDRRDEVFSVDEWARHVGVRYEEIVERHSFDPGIWPALRSLVRERHIHIVHAHDYKTNLLAWMLGRVEGIEPLSTVHGWTGHSWRERRLYYPLDKRVLARFPRLIAVSSEIRDELVQYGAPSDRISVILNGIDHRKFMRDPTRGPGTREQLGIHADRIVIGAVGRLEPQKRFDLLLEAVAQLRTVFPTIYVAIAGDGSARQALEHRAAELNLDGVCVFLGHCADVTDVHHAFDVFVQSSDYEGTPNAVLEAMAMETPIVATNVGGTGELVVNGLHGLVVPPGRADLLVQAIATTLQDTAATRARVRAARSRIEGELSFERRMTRVEAVYEEITAARGTAAHTRKSA